MKAVSRLFSSLSWLFLNAVVGQFHTSLRNCFAHSDIASSAPTVTLSVRSWLMLRRLEEELEEEASIALEREVAHDRPAEEEGIRRSVKMRMIGKAMLVKLLLALFGEN